MSTKKRIYEYLEYKGISPTSAEEELGWSKGALTKPISISMDRAEEFVLRFEDVSPDWLITGRGEMLRSPSEVNLLNHPKIPEPLSNREVILYDISAAANLKTLLGDKSQNILGKISIPDIPKCDGAVYVKGDSMYPLLKSGDIIAYKEIHDFENAIKGEIYLISFELDGDEYLTVKYVNKSDKDRYLKLVSYNPHHDPMDIPISSINAMALVKVSIRMNTMK